MTSTEILAAVKEWPETAIERFAAKLLVLKSPSFHGSKELHYASGTAKKIVDKPAACTREI